MDKMRFDGSFCERVRAYEKITKNCHFCHKRSRDVEIVMAEILFAPRATKKNLHRHPTRKVVLHFFPLFFFTKIIVFILIEIKIVYEILR